MNLYIFNESSQAAVYGIGTYIRELTEALSQSNINLCVVNLRSDKPHIQVEEINGIRHWSFPLPMPEQRTTDQKKRSELYHRNVVYLLQLHIEDKKDLIFHLNYIECKPLADALKSAFDCKIVLVVHYLKSVMTLLDNIGRLRRIISQTDELINEEEKSARESFLSEKKMFQFHGIDKIICLSHHAFDLLHQDFQIEKEKMTVIHNGLSEVQRDEANTGFLRSKWNIPLREKIILFAGRMDEIKGLEFLLKAFRTVLQSYPKCRLVIAGNGSFDKYTKESQDICTKITYTGLLDKSQLYEWYRLADVGVTPSLYEPFGYVAVEMMMHGLPIVATATSGLNEVVDDTCGLKIPLIQQPEAVEIDATLLSEKILYLLQHPAEAKKMGKNGRKRYKKMYTSKVFGQNMTKLYQSLFQP